MASEEDPFCNWCKLMLRTKGREPEELVLVANQRGSTVIDAVVEDAVVASFTELVPSCLCGRYV